MLGYHRACSGDLGCCQSTVYIPLCQGFVSSLSACSCLRAGLVGSWRKMVQCKPFSRRSGACLWFTSPCFVCVGCRLPCSSRCSTSWVKVSFNANDRHHLRTFKSFYCDCKPQVGIVTCILCTWRIIYCSIVALPRTLFLRIDSLLS